MSDSPRSVPDWAAALILRAHWEDGAPPFSDQSLVDFRTGDRELLAIGEDAIALLGPAPSGAGDRVVATPAPIPVPAPVSPPIPEAAWPPEPAWESQPVLKSAPTFESEPAWGSEPAWESESMWASEPTPAPEPAPVATPAPGREAEFVVEPDARSRGLGTRMLEALLARGATLFWAHGDAPAARALAASHGLRAVRELLHLSGRVPDAADAPIPEHFQVGVDEAEWVALNSKTFAHHPEQGSVTEADLEQLETEPWFSASNFLILREDGRMIGYCWLKVENDWGEFYVVGVDPDHHGQGLGSLLFDAGLARLRQLGINDTHLYVEGDNISALRLYHSRGLAQDSIDIQYSLS